ncbi:MAG: T9SS type A sorting domain-containing protein [Candidatus Cloacimonetes bacterium]|nr:T9SS type A sorting domain-containing protein [Candidatus Cloacimonadota bacterium]
MKNYKNTGITMHLQKLNKELLIFTLTILLMLLFVFPLFAQTSNIDATDKWAWGTNIGWVNFRSSNGGVTVYADHLEGYTWAENIGWIRMGTYTGGSPHTYQNDSNIDYGVNHDGAGNLSGYAWSTNAGWINFNPTHSQVTINMTTGSFDGYAWAENIGWIHFKNTSPEYNLVCTDPTLPVELCTFTAQFIENTPTIHWSTQSETDNMGWFICRYDENDFSSSEIISDMIEGHGTTTQQQFYTYEDDLENPEVGDCYYYWLESVDYGGIINHYDNVAILSIPDHHNSGGSGIVIPERFGLLQNEPNPVVSSTRIAFNLTETAQVDLSVYNLKGQLVKKLYSRVTSKHTVMWYGKDESGNELENGVYFYRLSINGKIYETRKLILLR